MTRLEKLQAYYDTAPQPQTYSEIELVEPQENGLEIDAYGLGVHSNEYSQPVKLRPDFGYVEGEHLEIRQDAYGHGVHADQYGRPIREQPWP